MNADPLAGLSPRRRAATERAAGGEPAYLRALATAGGVDPVDPTVPEAVRALVAAQLQPLSDGARALLYGAVVAGVTCDAPLAAIAAGLEGTACPPLLDELTAAGLVVDRDGTAAIHPPVVRTAIYSGLSAGRRLSAHVRCATALAQAGAPPELQAPHVAQSARPADAEARRLLHAAAAAVLERDPGNAARWLATEVRLGRDAGAPVEEELPAVLLLAEALLAAGHPATARDVLGRALIESHDDWARLHAISELPRHDRPIPQSAVDRITVGQGCADLMLGEYATAVARLRRLKGHTGDVEPALVALAATCDGDPAARVVALERARAANTSSPAAACWLAHAELLCGEPVRAERLLNGLLPSTDAAPWLVVPVLTARVLALRMLGDISGAALLAREAVAVARMGGDQSLAWSLWVSAVPLSALDPPAAQAAAEEAGSVGGEVAPALAAIGSWFAGRATLAAGHPEDVSSMVVAGCGGAVLPLIPAPLRPAVHATLAQAAAARDDVDAAIAWSAHADLAAAAVDIAHTAHAVGRARAAVDHAASGLDTAIPGLTARQAQIAALVAAGRTNRAIAEQLGLSRKTVESHLSAIFERLGVPTRAAVAAQVARIRRHDS